jgi:NMD protein affecting ribosome stability and mRNA decay
MSKFCPKCGKTILKGKFCDECNPETIDFKPINIKLSPSGKVFFQGKWTNYNSLRTLSETLVKKLVKQKVELITGLEAHEHLLEQNGLKKDVTIEVEYQEAVYKVPVNIEITLSPDVSKVGSTYFEGILQLRNARDDVKEYISNYCKKNKVYVNKLIDKGKEVDYYFVKKNELQPIGLKLMRNFGAEIESNARLFSKNRLTSKDIYRLSVLVTIPKFTVGDVVEYKEIPFFVKETGKIITGINLNLAKKSTFRNEEGDSVKIIPRFKSKITEVLPRPQVLDPETYASAEVENPLAISVKPEQNVQIVKYKGRVYLIK